MSRVRSELRIVAFIVAAALAIGVVAWRGIARRWVHLRPGPTLILAIDSAHPFDDGVAPDEARRRTLEALHSRLEKLAPTALATFEGDRVQVVLPRNTRPELLVRQLTRTGRLEFKIVDDGSAYMTHVAEQLAARRADDVEVAHDEWTDKSGAAGHDDIYVHAHDREAMTRVYATLSEGLPLPADHALAFEHRDDDWRSYYLFKRAELTGDNIEDAEVDFDQQSGRPEVSLSFDAAGARRFETLTAGAVGRKLAILLEGRVNSAPVIEGKIAGGHARITMGGYSDPFQLQSEAKDLVAVLRTGGLAAPVTLVEARPQP
jgi:preprotein translocase subunit SecD